MIILLLNLVNRITRDSCNLSTVVSCKIFILCLYFKNLLMTIDVLLDINNVYHK